MSKRVTRRKLLAGAAIPVAAVPLAKLAGAGENNAGASTSTPSAISTGESATRR